MTAVAYTVRQREAAKAHICAAACKGTPLVWTMKRGRQRRVLGAVAERRRFREKRISGGAVVAQSLMQA